MSLSTEPAVSEGRNNVFTLRNKFESLNAAAVPPPGDRRGTFSVHPTYYPLETNTLGRRVGRNSSFSFGSHPRSSSQGTPSSPVVQFPFIIRDRNGRYSNRSLQETVSSTPYDSYTIATPPRKIRQLQISSSVHASPNFSRKANEKGVREQLSVKLSPAQSMSSLSCSPSSSVSSSPSPLKTSTMSNSVFNLSIEPSQCVSQSKSFKLRYHYSLLLLLLYLICPTFIPLLFNVFVVC